MSEVDHEALARLKAASRDGKKFKEWNEYRKDHPKWKPCLSTKDEQADLSGLQVPSRQEGGTISLNLSEAMLECADLSDANCEGVNFSGANLMWAELSRAGFECTNLSDTCLMYAELRGTYLTLANLTGANLREAVLVGADLGDANLAQADVTDVKYLRSKMRGKYRGIRVTTCYGNALFKRDAQDQDFIDTLEFKLGDDLREAKGRWRRASPRVKLGLFRAWGWIDYGRSLWRVAFFATLLAIVFGFIYALAGGMLDYRRPDPGWFTPFYYSIVTYTTLGFGDVTPKTTMGEMIVTVEVIFGYLTLGLLVSILANKVARRS